MTATGSVTAAGSGTVLVGKFKAHWQPEALTLSLAELPLRLDEPVVPPLVALNDALVTTALRLPELLCELTIPIGAIAPLPAAAIRKVLIDELPVASAISMLPFSVDEPDTAPVVFETIL